MATRLYMTAVFDDAVYRWSIVFSKATSKKAAASMAFHAGGDLSWGQRSTENSLARYTSLVYVCPKTDRVWVSPAAWDWSSVLPADFSDQLDTALATTRELTDPPRSPNRFPQTREFATFLE